MRETKRRKPLVLLALLAIGFMTSGCASSSDPSATSTAPIEGGQAVQDIVASIGEVSISREELIGQLVASYGGQTLRSMMLQEAVKAEAKAYSIDVTDEELENELRRMKQGYENDEAFYRQMKEQLGMTSVEVSDDTRYRLLLEKLSIREVKVTAAEIDEYLFEHRKEWMPKKQYHLSQIVVESKEQAKEVLSRLKNGASFAALARTLSLDEFTVDSGGDLGWIEEDDPFVAEAVLQAAADLTSGDVAGPIALDEGYAVVRLDGRSVSQTKSEADIRDEVKRQLALAKAPSSQEFERALLVKYNADIKDRALREPSY